MAVIITKEPQGTILNAYNNSIIEFGTDIGTSARATIKVNNFIFEITPNKGVFYFNLKPAITALINQNAFADTVKVDLPINYIFPDNTLYREQEITITVFKLNGASESLVKTYKYLKSAEQITNRKFTDNSLLKILSPSKNTTRYITYFEGYPFDISILSNISRQVTLKNLITSTELTINLSKGVNRLFLSNGENDNQGFEGVFPLVIGNNQIEATFDVNQKIVFNIIKKPVDCGVYIKFFNQNGGWSYWLFNKVYKEAISIRPRKEINADFENIEDTVSRTLVSGKDANGLLNLKTGSLNENERFIVSKIFTSPKIYLYTNEELQPFELLDWKEVKTKNSSVGIRNTKKTRSEFEITIELPNQYTQNYAS